MKNTYSMNFLLLQFVFMAVVCVISRSLMAMPLSPSPPHWACQRCWGGFSGWQLHPWAQGFCHPRTWQGLGDGQGWGNHPRSMWAGGKGQDTNLLSGSSLQQMAARGKKAGGQSVGTNFSQKSFTLRPKSNVRGRQSGSAYTCPMICRWEDGWSGMDCGGCGHRGVGY